MLLDVINYGLTLINKKSYDNFDLYFKDKDDNKMDIETQDNKELFE